jgi:isopropylmalate/homocitrate/citramalate synthase
VGAPVVVCEVGPRDGLQARSEMLSVAARIELIDRLSAAGVARIEAASFVRDDRVPAMAGAEAVLSGIRRPAGFEVAALVMNVRGAERAAACRLNEVRFVVVASETFSRRNQNAGIAATLDALEAVAPIAALAGQRLSVVIGAAFGCPYEGRTPVSRVVQIAARAIDAGAAEVVLADTIGSAVPTDVETLVPAVQAVVRGRAVGGHFHNTRNMGFANAFAALRAGVATLDASIGGLGGCPFAPRATGNIATEDLVYLLQGMGVADLPGLAALLEVNRWLAERLGGEALPGLVARAGPFPAAVLS